MATEKRPFTMRMQPENFAKIKIISEKYKRSIAMQIEYLIEDCINAYEKEHGTISEKDIENILSMTPFSQPAKNFRK